MSWKVVTSVFLLGVMVHAYSPSIQEAEAERMLIWHQFGSSSETLFENKLNIHTVLLQLLLIIYSQMYMHTKHFLCHWLNKLISFIIAYVGFCEKMCILGHFLSPVSKSVNDICNGRNSEKCENESSCYEFEEKPLGIQKRPDIHITLWPLLVRSSPLPPKMSVLGYVSFWVAPYRIPVFFFWVFKACFIYCVL